MVAHGVSRGGKGGKPSASPGRGETVPTAFCSAPSGAILEIRSLPTACAVGYHLSPLPGLRINKSMLPQNVNLIQRKFMSRRLVVIGLVLGLLVFAAGCGDSSLVKVYGKVVSGGAPVVLRRGEMFQ